MTPGRLLARARMPALAGAWLLLAALVDATLIERWYGVVARKPLHLPELALNALPLAALGVTFLILVRALARDRLVGRALRREGGDLLVASVALLGTAGLFLVRYPDALGAGWGTRGPALLVALAALAILATCRARAGRALSRVVLSLALVGLLAGEALREPWALLRARAAGDGAGTSVVLIVIDTLRADHLGCYGHDVATSPEMDRLAAGGVRFAHAYAQASWTLPATASIHTGRLPSSHGATARGDALPEANRTLAECLDEAGYRTAAFSENQIVSARYGFAQGFDAFWSYWLPWISEETLVCRLLRRAGLEPLELVSGREYPRGATTPESLNWDARRTTDRALRWLRAGEGASSPFFLYLHYMGPHGPYGPPEFLLDGEAPPVRVADHPREMGGGHPLAPAGEPVSSDEMAHLRTLYEADIRYVDREVGRLVHALEAIGALEQTLIVVTSDHGEEFFEHGGWNHGGSVYEEIVHVPLILAGGPVAPGREAPVAATARQVDVLPTVLDAVGLVPPEAHGRSLAPLLTGDPPAQRGPDAFVEGCFLRPEGMEGTALVAARSKLIRVTAPDSTSVRLFVLDGDPEEMADRATHVPAVRDSLHRELLRWEQAARAFSPERRAVRLDPETLRTLRQLGYIQ